MLKELFVFLTEELEAKHTEIIRINEEEKEYRPLGDFISLRFNSFDCDKGGYGGFYIDQIMFHDGCYHFNFTNQEQEFTNQILELDNAKKFLTKYKTICSTLNELDTMFKNPLS